MWRIPLLRSFLKLGFLTLMALNIGLNLGYYSGYYPWVKYFMFLLGIMR